MKFIKIILSCLLFCSWFANAGNDAELKKIINSYSFDQNNYSLIVKNLTQPKKLNFEHNSQSLFNSASLVKIITTFMALEKLGPNFKWQSDFYHSGEIVEGILEGDLIFKGRGDASFSVNDLEKMIVRLRQLGIYKINGDLVIDSTYFGSMPQEKNFDNDPLRAYNVLPDAVSIQANTINFNFEVIDNEIKIFKDPDLEIVEVVNQISLTQDKCRNWKSKITYDVSQEKNMQKIIFGGSISRDCEIKEIDLYAIDDDIYFLENFKKLWLLSGGLFDGNLKLANEDTSSTASLVTHFSAPLSELIRDINKYSLNLMSRNLMLTMLAEEIMMPATEEDVNQFIHDWFTMKGFNVDGLFIDNGAGLSRKIKVSAYQLSELLHAIYVHPLMPEIIASLPISAIDGTLEKRMLYSPVNARGHFKTGSLKDVNAMAGFFLNKQNEMIMFIFLMNDQKAGLSISLQEKLIEKIFYMK